MCRGILCGQIERCHRRVVDGKERGSDVIEISRVAERIARAIPTERAGPGIERDQACLVWREGVEGALDEQGRGHLPRRACCGDGCVGGLEPDPDDASGRDLNRCDRAEAIDTIGDPVFDEDLLGREVLLPIGERAGATQRLDPFEFAGLRIEARQKHAQEPALPDLFDERDNQCVLEDVNRAPHGRSSLDEFSSVDLTSLVSTPLRSSPLSITVLDSSLWWIAVRTEM